MAKHIRHGVGAVRPYLYGDRSSLDLVTALGGEVIENAYVTDVDAAFAAAVAAVSVGAPKSQPIRSAPAPPGSLRQHLVPVDAYR